MLTSNTEGLQALHLVLVKARAKAFEDGNSELGEVLDAAEYLVTCVMSDEDKTEVFRDYLNGLGSQFPEYSGIASNFPTLSASTAEALSGD